MARTIESPGVEIRERDESFNTELPVGTTSLVVGYAKQGPTDELLNVTSREELEQVYGKPENAAERYAFHTAKQILDANGNLLFTRLPYGSGEGEGYSTKYSALVYPYIPVDVPGSCTTYSLSGGGDTVSTLTVATITADGGTVATVFSDGGGLTVDMYQSYTSNQFSLYDLTSAVCVTDQTHVSATVTYVSGISAAVALDTVFEFALSSTEALYVSSYAAGVLTDTALSAAKISLSWTEVALSSSDSVGAALVGDQNYTAVLSSNVPFYTGTIIADVTYNASLTGTGFSADDASHYYIGEPIHLDLDENTYFNWLQGGINWKQTVTAGRNASLFSGTENAILSSVGEAAMVIVNENKTTIGDNFEGTYIAVADNTKLDKGSNFDSVRDVKSLTNVTEEHEWITLNDSALAFPVTGTYFEKGGSVSEVVESIPDFDFSNNGPGGFGDSLVVGIFKVRPSIYNQEERVLDSVLFEAHMGSLDSSRTLQNQQGGSPVTFYLEDVINDNSNGMKCFVNPYISEHSGTWYDQNTQEPKKFVRVVSPERDQLGSSSTDVIGTTPSEPQNTGKVIYNEVNRLLGDNISEADNLYGIGEYTPCDPTTQKNIGNLPRKLEKALRLAENYELLRLDLVPEGGLGTIWTGMNLDLNNYSSASPTSRSDAKTKELYDENVKLSGILEAHSFDADNDYGLRDQAKGSSAEAQDLWESIATVFNQFCQFTRKDCLQIADPLRHIFVQGRGDVKVLDNKTLNFSQHIFWPLKNLFGGLNTSYACAYANWFKVNDTISDRFVWVPSSGFAANLMIKTDTNFFPWYAPAGLTRGLLSGILDIGINPSQKQRDLLYKNGINPTVYWPGDGYVIWGQKTLQKKPSAFDRVNVRRMFLWAEKAVMQVARYFVFEQNTPFTRNRLKTAIDPILAFARSNEGIYDYLIVCDDRNNTSEVIDRNELIVDIYIKPVRVAEYILINFIATRTGQRFDELV